MKVVQKQSVEQKGRKWMIIVEWIGWLDTSSGARAVVGTALAMPGLCSGSEAQRSPITGPRAIRQLLISSRLSAINSCCPNASC